MRMIMNRIDIYKTLFTNLTLNHNQKISKYTSVDEEYRSFYESASVYDASHYSIFRVTGKDSLDFLHRISTNDLLNLDDFTVKTTLLLNEKGRLIDKIKLLKFQDHMILIGSPENSDKIHRWIERYSVLDDIKLEQLNDSILYLKILGKKFEIFFTLLFGDQLKNLEEYKIYKYVGENFQCWVIKDEVFPDLYGYLILCDELNRENLIKYVKSNLMIFSVHFIGEEAFEIIRIEQGEPAFPNEMNDSFNPYDINLIKYVSFTKGCYIGQEVIARLDTYEKVKFCLSGFVLNEDYNFDDKTIYLNDNTEVGVLTSKVFSPGLNKVVALGVHLKKINIDEHSYLFVKDVINKINLKKINLPMIKL